MKIYKTRLFAFAFLAFINTTAKAMIEKEKNSSSNENSLFSIYSEANSIDVSKDIANATFLELNFNVLNRLIEERQQSLSLSIPLSQTQIATLNLHSSKVISDGFILSTDKKDRVKYTPGVYYQGFVEGEKKSIAAVSLFDSDVMGVFTINGENYVLGLWEHEKNTNKNIYILFKEKDIKNPKEFKCGTDDALEFAQKSKIGGGNPEVQSDNCIKIYFECDYQMYQDKGTVNGVTNYVTGFFNIVQTIFTNETVNTEISEIYVWTTTDPYVSNTTTTGYLNSFKATRTTFNGNLAHLLTTRPLNIGGIAFINVICSTTSPYGFSNIENTYEAYPNYSNTTYIVAHELGHNFGSRHTHWCGWPGGAIDDCYTTEGGCASGPTPPTNGGTMMSYCNLTVGINLANGFGTLPGNTIRTAFNGAACLTPCIRAPEAAFSSTTPNGCTLPQTINFTDESTFGATSWAWDINNDGTTDYTTQNPSHTYTVSGTYTVRLIATNSNGSDTITKPNLITVGGTPAGITTAITSGSSSFCAGTSVTFTATPVNGGTTPTYQWYVNSNPVSGATGVTFTTDSLSGNPVVTCQITSSDACAIPATATSTGITITVTPSVTPQITIAISSGNDTICAGESVTFNSTTSNAGNSPSYQWLIGTTPVGTGSTYSSSTLANGDSVRCTLTSNAACATPTVVTSSPITMVVSTVVSPTVTIAISSGTNPMCQGSSISFLASTTNGGATPTYQWYADNNPIQGATSATFTSSSLSGNPVITCQITSSASCASPATVTSAGITLTVTPNVTPQITIGISSGNDTICAGETVTFNSTTSNAGNSPSYQWLVGTTPVGTGSTYSSSTLTNGDSVRCTLTSNAACATPTAVTSSPIAMVVSTVVSPTVTIAISSGTNPMCQGSSISFLASTTNGGTTPTYQWYADNNPIQGATSATFTSSSLSGNPVITCQITSSSSCATPSTVTSAGITLTVTSSVTPQITIGLSSGNDTICAGETVTFNSTTSNAGNSPSYQWLVGTTPVGTGSTYSSSTFANGDLVTCTLTSNATCANPTVVTSAAIAMVVDSVATPTATIVISSGTNPMCSGSLISFAVSSTNSGSNLTTSGKRMVQTPLLV